MIAHNCYGSGGDRRPTYYATRNQTHMPTLDATAPNQAINSLSASGHDALVRVVEAHLRDLPAIALTIVQNGTVRFNGAGLG